MHHHHLITETLLNLVMAPSRLVWLFFIIIFFFHYLIFCLLFRPLISSATTRLVPVGRFGAAGAWRIGSTAGPDCLRVWNWLLRNKTPDPSRVSKSAADSCIAISLANAKGHSRRCNSFARKHALFLCRVSCEMSEMSALAGVKPRLYSHWAAAAADLEGWSIISTWLTSATLLF